MDLDGEFYEINAKVLKLAGYSAHADQSDLVRFATSGVSPAEKIILVHGEAHAKKALADVLIQGGHREGLCPEVIIAQEGLAE